MLGSPTSLVAQTVPSVVEEVKTVTLDENRAAFLVRFSPAEPQSAALNNNPTRPELLLRSTLRAPRVPPQGSYRGLVRSSTFETTDSGLLWRFDTAAPAQVSVQPAGDRTLQVIVQRLSGDEAIGARPIGSGGEAVAPASELPAYVEPGVDGDSYELVPLKYADVSEVIGLLVEGETIQPNNVFIRREPGFGSIANSSTQYQYQQQQQQQPQNQQPLGQSFPGRGLAIDRRLNAIWITGTPERIARVKAQINAIDVPVDSVILETQFVELTEQGVKNLGLDLANRDGQIASGQITLGANTTFGNDPLTPFKSGVLQAAIYAQVQRGEGRIVSRPRIAAQSGSTAKIITGDALPILTSITLSGVNGVSQQVQYVNVGVTLQIAPRVSTDGFVTSQIYGVVSSVTGYSQGYPTISQREAETSASVRDGETFVIGGLTQENNLRTKGRLPILGDIPILGTVFRNERSTRAKTELYIVITPRIVRHRRNEVPVQPAPSPAVPGLTGGLPG
ncbi:secretin N-terminal domain-containing protein [Sphingomonas kaistensis]|uniref:Secretin N-terminal domain-containing protein n=1 Tax=Sphingomonas kaistensis TaxID=298708 RepID=A0ABZ2G2L0_9SPHN